MENDNDIEHLIKGDLYYLCKEIAEEVKISAICPRGLHTPRRLHRDGSYSRIEYNEIINNSLFGMYLGSRYITVSWKPGRAKRLKSYRKLAHVFLWGNMEIFLHPSYVKKIDDKVA